ncbi:sulfur-oxidizing protein SoxX [Meinhardsimonia xiamenensis]|jgi:sulfur-oxidizing protein SoxX|uniref:Sulfur-oxidizing protein SoxX n=1 Tax=Meinhardsimonia xiamenensis TaxID=990712 RepID=A0A1G9GFI9_9RHOB|nr:sulfur oxidation c-type cytochrome SoxX [Meinhardsimonia xiamenensis]PRX31913.1 sulfur-oxidizing protein SoxX [Meinhardsimonia xiamenensis]SDK99424.1 sulfur-oxidizing protein SoxX [Meinhardsimonia xiamenensis]
MIRTLTAASILLAGGVAAQAGAVPPIEVQYDEYGAVAQSLTGVPGNPEEGAKVMTTRGLGNCIACHEVTALSEYPFHGNVGPSLDGVADRWTEAELRGIVADAKKTFPDTVMISFYKDRGFIRPGIGFTGKPAEEPLEPLLTAQQIEDVVAFLMTLKEE